MFNRLNIKRVSQIVQVLGKYEYNHIINELNLTKYLPLHKRFQTKDKNNLNPILVREIFEELGGAFIKLGQLLALRPDLINKEYSQEFEKLLDNTTAMPFQNLKEKLKNIPLKNISKIPLGCGSIAQVHKATLNNKEVAIKIKKNNVDNNFNADIAIMEYFAKKISKRFNISYINLEDIVQEFKKYTKKELDLTKELKSIQTFQKNFKDSKDTIIPNVYPEYSTKDILIMEFIEGKNIMQIDESKRNKTISIISNAVYKMIFEDRFFHADLHPGNIFFNKEKIIFLDYGITQKITKQFEDKLFYLFTSLVQADLEGTVNALIDLNIGDEIVNEDILTQGLSEVLGDYYNLSIKEMNFAEIFYGSIEVAKESKIKLPAQIILFGKSLITMEGFCRQVNSSFNIVEDAKPYVKRILRQKSSPREIIKQKNKISKEIYFSFSKFPKNLKTFYKNFDMIQKNMSSINKNMNNFETTFIDMIKIISLTILFTTFIMASLFTINYSPQIKNISIYSIMGFIISIFLLLNLIRLFLKN